MNRNDAAALRALARARPDLLTLEVECEGCGEVVHVDALVRVHGAGDFCRACHDDHPLTIERARADMNEED